MRLDLGPDLAALRAEAMLQIDRDAEACRQRFVTPGAGQAMEYTATEAEARRYQANPGAPFNREAYPFLFAEIEALQGAYGPAAPTPEMVAAEVVGLTDAWTAVGSEIKRLRRLAKLQVDQAATPAEVRAATAIAWPQP